MSWWDDLKTGLKTAWEFDLPITGTPWGPASAKDLLKAGGGIAASLPILYGAGSLPGVKEFLKPGIAAGIGRPPVPVHTPTFAPSTPTDRPRPSMLDAVVPGTRRRTAYGTLTRGKTLGQVVKETAIREGTKELKTRLKRRKSSRTGGASPRRRKSRFRATSGESLLDYEPPKKRRRSTKPPSRKQLAARRRFAEMARARARSRRR